MRSQNIYYDITSNLSFDVNDFLKIATNCIGVVCSFHPSNPKNSDSYFNNFCEKVRILSVLPNTRINFVASPQNIKYYNCINEFCIKNNIILHVDKYVPLNGKNKILFEDIEQEQFAKKIVSDDRSNMANIGGKAIKCSAGYDHLVMFPDGNIYPCLNFAQKKQGCIGNITEKMFRLNTEYMQCGEYPNCAGCDLDSIKIVL